MDSSRKAVNRPLQPQTRTRAGLLRGASTQHPLAGLQSPHLYLCPVLHRSVLGHQLPLHKLRVLPETAAAQRKGRGEETAGSMPSAIAAAQARSTDHAACMQLASLRVPTIISSPRAPVCHSLPLLWRQLSKVHDDAHPAVQRAGRPVGGAHGRAAACGPALLDGGRGRHAAGSHQPQQILHVGNVPAGEKWRAVASSRHGTRQAPACRAPPLLSPPCWCQQHPHLPSGLSRVPAGKAVSSTHCCPPQSKPSSSSLHPTRMPSLQHRRGMAASRRPCVSSKPPSKQGLWHPAASRQRQQPVSLPLTSAASTRPPPGSLSLPTLHPAAPAPAAGHGTASPTGPPPPPPLPPAAG